MVRRLFGRLQSSTISRAKKIHKVSASILKGQRTLPEIMSNNIALDFLRHGLLKVHKKTNTSIDFPEITIYMDNLYSLPTFKGRLEDLFMVIESSGLLKKAGLLDGDILFFKAHAAMIKRDIRIFERLYLELEENSIFSHICDLDGYIPSPRSFGRFRERAIPSLEKLNEAGEMQSVQRETPKRENRVHSKSGERGHLHKGRARLRVSGMRRSLFHTRNLAENR